MFCVSDGNAWLPARTPEEFESVRVEVGDDARVRSLIEVAGFAANELHFGGSWDSALARGDLVIDGVPYMAAAVDIDARLRQAPETAVAGDGWDDLVRRREEAERYGFAHGDCVHFALAVSELLGGSGHVALYRGQEILHVATRHPSDGTLLDARGAFEGAEDLFRAYRPGPSDRVVEMDSVNLRREFKEMRGEQAPLPLVRATMTDAFALGRKVLAETGIDVRDGSGPERFPDLVGFEVAVYRAGRFENPTLFDDVILGRNGTDWPGVAAHVRAGGPAPEPEAPAPSP